MKKKEFPYYDKDYDEEKDLFIHKYFDSDEWGEMELIIDENKVIGACYDDFSPSQYNNI